MSRTRWLWCLALVPLLYWCVVSTPIQAQNDARWDWDVFRSTPSGEGPASDTITSLVLDGGRLWVGTDQGLSRYDGGAWDAYLEKDGLPDDEIQALLIDRNNYLWVGTKKGMLLLGPERRWADSHSLPENINNIVTLSLAGDEGVWVGTLWGDAYRISALAEGTDQQPDPDIHLNNTVEAIWENTADDVWFGTRGGGLVNWNNVTKPYTEAHGLPSSWVHALWGNEGQLWVGTEEGVCCLSLTNPDAGCRSLELLRGQAVTVTGLFPGPDNSVFVATDKGLKHFHGDCRQGAVQLIEEIALDVRAVVEDAEGQLWLGTDQGLVRRRAHIWQQLLPESPGLETDEKDVLAIAEDADGNLWVATGHGLKWQRSDSSSDWFSVAQLIGEAVHCLWPEKDGSLWICRERGIARVSPSGKLDALPGDHDLADLSVNAIRRGPDDALWLATERGVWRGDGLAWSSYRQVTANDGPGDKLVYSIAPDGSSGLWFATLDGLSHYDGQKWHPPAQTECQVTDLARALAAGEQGRVWVGAHNGLILCGGDQQPKGWNKSNGLVANDIRALAVEAASRTGQTTLWIGTFDGLSRANLSEEIHEQLPIVSFAGESLPDDQVQAIHVSRNNDVLIGTPNGLWAYQPSPASPQIRLRHRDHDTVLRPEQPLELAYNNGPVTLTAVGGDLRTPLDDLIYRYDIGGKSSGWLLLDGKIPGVDIRMGSTITATVWAYDRDFNQSADAARLQVIRRPMPLQNQPWFFVLVGTILVLVSVILSIVIYRAVRARPRHGYRDLELTVSPGAEPGMHLVQLTARRDPVFSDYSRTVAWELLREPLAQLCADQTDEDQLRRLGGGLYESLFSPEATVYLKQHLKLGGQLYDSLFSPEATAYLKQHLKLGRKGVRLRLRFDDVPQLAAMPWEFLHGGDDLGFLTGESDVALVRDLSPEESEETPPTRRPLKLLVAWATPQDLPRLDVAEEVAVIEEAFAGLVGKKRAVVQVLEHARPEMFIQAVQEGYDLIHFIGHGGVQDGIGILYFEDEDGDSVSMVQRELIALLAEAPTFTDKTVKLAVLNACRTAEPEDSEGLAGLAAALVTEGRLPAIVGMGYPITSESAAIFSRAFYETLVRYRQVDYAVAEGREALFVGVGAGRRDWGVPRLYMRTPEGIIFKFK